MRIKAKIILLAGIILTFDILASDLSRPTHPPALPNTAERTLLAEQHANCAGIYGVLYNAALKKQNPNNQAIQKTYHSTLENHVKFALILFGDESKAMAKIDNAFAAFISELQNSKAGKNGSSIADAKMKKCVQVDLQTIDFIKRAM